jgi:sterol desaturase/sphingolipid hydroxylase (fatty acid hydroxylase superfamily)
MRNLANPKLWCGVLRWDITIQNLTFQFMAVLVQSQNTQDNDSLKHLPHKSTPPLGRFSLVYIIEFFLSAWVSSSGAWLYHYYGFYGMLIAHASRIGVVVYDLVFGDRFWRDLEILRLNGFTDQQIWQNAIMSFIIACVGEFMTVRILFYRFGFVEPHLDFFLILKVFIFLAASEVGFTTGHLLIHTKLAKYHVMHHCCTNPSYTSSYIFHPLDILVEFGLPVAIIMPLNDLLFQDHFAAVLGISVIALWYTMDHDYMLQLPHFNHHRYINRAYNAYLSSSYIKADDQVVHLVKRVKSN